MLIFRCQRVSACFTFLFLSMLGNALWFGTISKDGANPINVFGFFTVTWPEIWMGLLINVLTFPFVFLIVFLFKYSKPSKLRSNTVEKSLREDPEEENVEENSDDDDNDNDLENEDDNDADNDAENEDENDSLEEDDEVEEDVKSLTSIDSSATTTSDQSLGTLVTRPRFSLPHFCVYVGWLLCFSFIVLSCFFLWVYGITFGNEFILTWFTAVVISFFTSFLVFEPLKVNVDVSDEESPPNVPSRQVLGYVMIQSLTCKMDLDEDFDDSFEDEEAYVLQQDEAWYSDEKIIKTKVYRYAIAKTLSYF